MDYSTLPSPPEGMEESQVWDQMPQQSLYEALQALPDIRRGAGKRYPLPVLVCLLCLAKMAGQCTLKGATEWVRLRAELLARSFGLKRTAMPCQMTYTRMLERVDTQVLMDLLAAFFTRWEAQQRCGNEPSRLQTEAGHREHAHIAHSWQSGAGDEPGAPSRLPTERLRCQHRRGAVPGQYPGETE